MIEEKVIKNGTIGFYKEDYKLRIEYLNQHFSRMWTRFNFFLTIESALFGILFRPPNGAEFKDHALLVIPIALLLCICWYAFGAQDRYLVELYRKQIEYVKEELNNHFELSSYDYVGQTNELEMTTRPKYGLFQWRFELISTTKLAAVFPLIFAVLWGVVSILIWRCGI